jgi:hypothetical protein
MPAARTSPTADVAQELVDGTRPPFAVHTPPRERRQRRAAAHNASPLQQVGWRSPTHNGPERSPWHASKIVSVLQTALAPSATVETLLRGTNSLFLCASESAENRAGLRSLPSCVDLAAHLYDRSDASHSGARVKEHVVNSLTLLVGEDAEFDNAVAFHDRILPSVIPAALGDRHAAVVLAAARFVRRFSEISNPDDASRQLVFTDDLFDAIIRRHETCEDVAIRTHLLCGFVNVSAHPTLHFFLARCQRLLHLLLDEIFAGGVAGAQINAAQWESELTASPGQQQGQSTARGLSPRSALPGVLTTGGRTPNTPGSQAASRSLSLAAGGGAGSPSASIRKLRSGLVDVSPLRRYVKGTTPRRFGTGASVASGAAAGGGPSSPGRKLTTGTLELAATSPWTTRGAADRSVATSMRPVTGHPPVVGAASNGTASPVDRRLGGVLSSNGAAAFDAAQAGALDLCELALRVFDNLLASDEQCAEIKRAAPSLVQAVVDCRSSPSEGVVVAATSVLRRLHDLDRENVDREVAHEVLQGRATSHRLRSSVSDGFLTRGVPCASADYEDDDDLRNVDYHGSSPQLKLPPRLGDHSTTASHVGTAVSIDHTDDGAGWFEAATKPAEAMLRSATDLINELLGR